VVTHIESDCSEQSDLTELTQILNSVHTIDDSLLIRRVPLSVLTNIESDSSKLVDMTEMTPIVNTMHTSNDSLQKRRVPLSASQVLKVTLARMVTWRKGPL
jgi:hypothetical protein